MFFYFVFTAEIGSSGSGHIALDDIEIDLTACPTTGPPTTTVDWQTHPDHKDTKGDCNFENGYCYWVQAKSPEDDMNWKRTDKATDSISTGPQFDYTLGTPAGHFAYIEASS